MGRGGGGLRGLRYLLANSPVPVVVVRGGTAGGGELPLLGCDACVPLELVANLRWVSPICQSLPTAPLLCSHGFSGVAMSVASELGISETPCESSED